MSNVKTCYRALAPAAVKFGTIVDASYDCREWFPCVFIGPYMPGTPLRVIDISTGKEINVFYLRARVDNSLPREYINE